MSSLKRNFIYNIAYQILALILPLITTPYVSRILGANNIGIYSYTYSIAYYFMIISMLGINNYGNRTIAKCRDNKDELTKNFWNIYYLQLIMSFFMIIIYLFYLAFVVKENQLIASIQILYIISAMLDINWFFFGIEKFKKTVIRSSLVKIISFVLIFALIKKESDLWIYTLILSGSTLFSQIIMHYFLKNEIGTYKFNIKEILIHFKPCLILFIPVIAISLYKMMDKIMLGIISNTFEVGLYEQAEKIVNVPTSIMTALGTVMLPRISNLVAKGNDKKVNEYIDKSIKFMMFMAYPMCFGLIAISKYFIPLFLGKEFIKSSLILSLLSITLIFISFASVIRKQYLVPKEKDNIFIVSVIIGAIVNITFNLILIPLYSSIGAVIGTIMAEFTVMFYQTIKVKKELPVFKYILETAQFLIKSLVMLVVIYPINYSGLEPTLIILLQIFIGIFIYFIFIKN